MLFTKGYSGGYRGLRKIRFGNNKNLELGIIVDQHKDLEMSQKTAPGHVIFSFVSSDLLSYLSGFFKIQQFYFITYINIRYTCDLV